MSRVQSGDGLRGRDSQSLCLVVAEQTVTLAYSINLDRAKGCGPPHGTGFESAGDPEHGTRPLLTRLSFRRLDQRAFRRAPLIGSHRSFHLRKESYDQVGLLGIHT